MRMIFHVPFPLVEGASSASGIRPVQMLRAFKESGYEVDVVSGYKAERSKSIREIKRKIGDGVKYDFVYSESSTQPTALTEKRHFPFVMLLDFSFFFFCRRNGVPVGLFYRDIYWRFSSYGKGVAVWKALIARLFYWYDIVAYRLLLSYLFLPSKKMGKFVPLLAGERHGALPPGHSTIENQHTESHGRIRILYVGGIGEHYRMHELVKAVRGLSSVHLVICTRKNEWNLVAEEYGPLLSANVEIVHESGEALLRRYRECDIASLYVEPQPYRDFAAPFKLYEYLGQGKPILCSAGTLAGDFILESGIGWAISYNAEQLRALLEEISCSRAMISEKRVTANVVARKHTWVRRAEEVATRLVSIK